MTMTLKGMTWSHPRGYDPMVACSEDWLKQTGVAVEWDKRSLQDFESYPVEELARLYDLIVIDHPHVGQITAENWKLFAARLELIELPGKQEIINEWQQKFAVPDMATSAGGGGEGKTASISG